MNVNAKQKRLLRSKAHHLQPIFQVGKAGISPALLDQVVEALEKRELIKISLLQNTDTTTTEVAEALEQAIHCEIVQIIGRVLIVFKPSTKEKYQKISREIANR